MIESPWTYGPEDTAKELDTDINNGLSQKEIDKRREEYGKNVLKEAKKRSSVSIFVEQFKSLIILILAVAAIVSFAFGENLEGIAVVAVVLVTVLIGFFTELRAVRSMESLREMSKTEATVLRDGEISKINAESLVPGDIVHLEGGDLISADMRLFETNKLQTDESPLTGESVPVTKHTDELEKDIDLAERKNMVFKGTAVTKGSGKGIVTSTGTKTELGKISELVEEAESDQTPLEQRLHKLSHKLIWVILFLSAMVIVAGIIRDQELIILIETSVALALSAIPEGLPIVATVALARGMKRMARRNALINQLASVETLGATNLIFTDKTGTLTKNKMTATRYELVDNTISVGGKGFETEGEFENDNGKLDPSGNKQLAEALKIGVLCNNATMPKESENDEEEAETVGDPLEVALLVAGAKAGLKRDELLEKYPEEKEVAFDSETKKMATLHSGEDNIYIAVKGAPEEVIDACSFKLSGEGEQEFTDEERKEWKDKNIEMAEEGLRILALAYKNSGSKDDDPYEDLVFVGLTGLIDPPREDIKGALEECREAGIGVVMLTGDHPVTAKKVAQEIHLVKDDDPEVFKGEKVSGHDDLSENEKKEVLEAQVFARMSPKEKLDLIKLQQDNNNIVAMTGDGVNDAPALKKADIGIAMGKKGTEVAREASDMILKDDNFSTIIAAIKQGRIIFQNIRKFVIYLISGNVGEVLAVALASFLALPLPLLPLQILFLNVILDVFPALALGVGEGNPGIMKEPPRDPKESILEKRHWAALWTYGGIILISVLAALWVGLNTLQLPQEQAVTVSFLTLSFSRLTHVFNMRDNGSGIFINEITRNKYVWLALLVCVALLMAAVFMPGLSTILKTEVPPVSGWLTAIGFSLLPVIVGQILKITGVIKD